MFSTGRKQWAERSVAGEMANQSLIHMLELVIFWLQR